MNIKFVRPILVAHVIPNSFPSKLVIVVVAVQAQLTSSIGKRGKHDVFLNMKGAPVRRPLFLFVPSPCRDHNTLDSTFH